MVAEEHLAMGPLFLPAYWQKMIANVREPLYLLKSQQTGQLGMTQSLTESVQRYLTTIGLLPALYPEWLGDQTFLAAHQVRFPYIVGEMANGIATAKMAVAAARAGMLGFFGAAGLMPNKVAEALHHIQTELSDTMSFGSNLIHSPSEPHLEQAIVDLYLHLNVRRVSASAYMGLTLPIVQYAVSGLRVDETGQLQRKNFVFAKISRAEVAKHFLSPAPTEMLEQLITDQKITREEAHLARHIPLAEDITVEADSGGHTDNRPMTALFSTIQQLARQLSAHYDYSAPIRLGIAGGLGTPGAVAAAFAMGAAYVMTGSINQSAMESGLSTTAKNMLLAADMADVIMAPAADMFELGVKLQVLKRGTLFAMRAAKLYEVYTRYPSLDAIPAAEKIKLENDIFKATLDTIWQGTVEFFTARDPQQITLAEANPKHKMALVFRWYLGLSSQWAIQGDPARKLDYQIWCGPAMGAFNKWVENTFLAQLNERTVEQIGRNLLEGAAVITRAQQCRSYGFYLPTAAFEYSPRHLM